MDGRNGTHGKRQTGRQNEWSRWEQLEMYTGGLEYTGTVRHIDRRTAIHENSKTSRQEDRRT